MSDVKRYTESCMEGGGVVPDVDGELLDWADYDRDMRDAECQAELLRLAADQFRDERDAALNQVETLRSALSYLLHVIPVLPPAAKLIVGMQTKYDLAVRNARDVLQAKP